MALWIFESQGIHQEALEALALFCHAAKAEQVQADWARRLVRYLGPADQGAERNSDVALPYGEDLAFERLFLPEIQDKLTALRLGL